MIMQNLQKAFQAIDRPVKTFGVVFGDQLNLDSDVFEHLQADCDALLMMEVLGESNTPVSSWQRSTLFLSAMRHFANGVAQDWRLRYFPITQKLASFIAGLEQVLQEQQALNNRPEFVAVLPGDYQVKQAIDSFVIAQNLVWTWLADNHFISQQGEFAQWLKGRKQPRMEYYYRQLRQRTGYLMSQVNGKALPAGGNWNYDKENRKSFGKNGPENLPKFSKFIDDESVRQVVQALQQLHDSGDLSLAGNPQSVLGDRSEYLWPVTREQALQVLQTFVSERLAKFGDYQDAMWRNEPWLYHSWISSSLNLKLLNPREVIAAALAVYEQGGAPINAVEGFIRQILGWREYVRGLYWSYRDQWLQMNALQANRDLPSFYWNGQTQMHCLSQSLDQVLRYGYGHHIQRLMVTGLFALLYGVKPKQVHEWYLGMYVDAVAWVEVPNTIGMSQFADGGIVGSKPYIASGAYIQKMSNYCQNCRYDPKVAVGDKACPMTTLYWDFIARHEALLNGHPRLGMQWRNWSNKKPEQQSAIRQRAQWLFDNIEVV